MRILISAALLCATSAHAAGVPGQGTWETTLQARDINHDGTVDAYYDSELHITWLADANLPLTSGYDTHSPPSAPGAMSWSDANTWAQTLDLYGVTGWRLPAMFLPTGCTQTSFSCSGAPGEMSHLFEHTLGGTGNTGPFTHMGMDSLYWSGTLFSYQDAPGSQRSFGFSFANGGGSDTDELGLSLYAWGVHDGDVAAVPEPQVAALLLTGLGALAVATRRPRT
jgi:hypothetical protein